MREPERLRRKPPVDGGGIVGGGCGLVVGAALGVFSFLGTGRYAVVLIVVVALVCAVCGAMYGDRFFEKGRYWWW